MSLDPTSRESNLRDSIKKYFVDSLYTTEGIQLTFDVSLPAPKVQGNVPDRWVVIDIGDIRMDNVSEVDVRLYCCVKHDPEGFRLAQLRDTVYGYLYDHESTRGDSIKRITHYRSRESGAWTDIGRIMIFIENESSQLTASDESKFKYFNLTLKFTSK
jgi:hypothetical protein